MNDNENRSPDLEQENEQPESKGSSVKNFLIAFVVAAAIIAAVAFGVSSFLKGSIHPSEQGSSSSSTSEPAASEAASSESSDSNTADSSSSEANSESESSSTNNNSGNKGTSGSGTSAKKTATQQQQILVEPRMKEKTETWADRPIEPDEYGYYGVLYCPDINTEESIFFGDEDKYLDVGWGQQTDTFIVGYECAHLFWSNNEKCVQEMQWMYPGLRFQIETASGIYVYEVETYANGHWDVNPNRRDVTEYRIYNNNKDELADIYTTYDVVYFAHEKDDGSVDVVEAHLVI